MENTGVILCLNVNPASDLHIHKLNCGAHCSKLALTNKMPVTLQGMYPCTHNRCMRSKATVAFLVSAICHGAFHNLP